MAGPLKKFTELIDDLTAIGAERHGDKIAAHVLKGGMIDVVQAGDTLPDIAARHGRTVETLLIANDLDSADEIFVGQELRVPNEDID